MIVYAIKYDNRIGMNK